MTRLDPNKLPARASLPQMQVPYLPGIWRGGRIFIDAQDKLFFVPLGTNAASIREADKPMRFLGDGQRNEIGYGEIRLTNPAMVMT